MKKLFSYVLALTLLVSTMSVAFAAPADVTDKDEVQAVDVLMALGVVDGYDDGSFKPMRVVSRAEMAKLVVTALGYENLAAGSTSNFDDVAANHWANGYIGVCVSLGIVQGYGDGNFGPENPVKYSEAATMLVRALGWTDEALGGIWPTNYVARAMNLGIFEGVNYMNAGAVRGDIAQMLFNTLTEGIGTIDQNGQYQPSTTDNMLTRLGGQLLSANPSVYQGTLPTASNLRKHIGERSLIYTNAAGNKVLTTINKATTLVGQVNATGNKFKVGNKKYNLPTFPVVAANAYETYLDAAQTNPAQTAALSNNGNYMLSVDVSGMNITRIYAASQWTVDAGDNALATTSNLATIANAKTLLGESFKQKADGTIDEMSFELLGVNALSDIKKNDVVYVYDDTTNITKVAVGTTVIENAKITKRTANKVTVNGTEYMVSSASGAIGDLFTNNVYLPVNKNDFDFRLDYYGKIYAVEPAGSSTTNEMYGVLLSTQDKGTIFSGNTEAKAHLFLADGTDKVFEVVGANTTLLNATGNWLAPATGNYGDIVEYTTNANGQITSFEMPTETPFAVATPTTITGSLIDDGTNSATITADTKVFTYDGSGVSLASSYGTMTVADLKGTSTLGGDVAIDSGNAVAVVKTNGASSAVYAVTVGSEAAVVGGYQNDAYTDGSLVNYISNTTQGLTAFTLYSVTLSNGKATFGGAVGTTSETANLVTGVSAVTLIGNTIKATQGASYNYLVLESDVEIYAQATDGTVSVLTAQELADKLNAAEIATIVTFDAPTVDNEMDIVLVTLN